MLPLNLHTILIMTGRPRRVMDIYGLMETGCGTMMLILIHMNVVIGQGQGTGDAGKQDTGKIILREKPGLRDDGNEIMHAALAGITGLTSETGTKEAAPLTEIMTGKHY